MQPGNSNPTASLISEQSGRDPLSQFEQWQGEVRRSGKIDLPEAACLSTVDPEGWPEGRIVLVKRVGADGFVFFTNTGSNKAKALASTPRAGLTFYWESVGRQIRVQGTVQRLSDEGADAYFATRPRWSQLGAWASEQSRILENRGTLLRRVAQTALKYWRKPVPRPSHWGGYQLLPRSIEFWQRRAHRLHDRMVYQRTPEGGWSLCQLYP